MFDSGCGHCAAPAPEENVMGYTEQLPRKQWSRKDMLKRVARFSKLKGYDGGLPDSYYPGAERILYNVIGFQPPPDEAGGMQSPVGAQAARMAAIKITEGFNLGYCHALPGHGPMMHNHDTNETFIAMTGTWRASWEAPGGKVEHVDLKPYDVISFPPGAIRRFENVTKGPKNKHALLMFVIGGDAPRAEFTADAVKTLASVGLTSEQGEPLGKPKAARAINLSAAQRKTAAKRTTQRASPGAKKRR
jgi:mannose-6-phosphate isomerase-like protein (cupin superfamily)